MMNNISPVPQPQLPDAEKKQEWIQRAEEIKPRLRHTTLKPVCEVCVKADPDAWQGWKMEKCGSVKDTEARVVGGGESFSLDFGQHLVGRLSFDVVLHEDFADEVRDCPLRIKVVFAEAPIELAEDPMDYRSEQTLSWSWFQDEYVTLDDMPTQVKLERRFAFRYVRFEIIDNSNARKVVCIRNVRVKTESSVGLALPSSPSSWPEDLRKIDEVSIRTLRDCMQTVFEDGPKRDRRLWLGDVRLQMLTDQVTYKNADLVERCILLFAGLSKENGSIPACLYERPKIKTGIDSIMDYSLLFCTVLLDYVKSGGNLSLVREMWPLAVRQTNFVMTFLDSQNVFQDPGTFWLFIDWNEKLHKQACLHAILLYAMQCNQKLAEILGEPQADWMRLIEYIRLAGRKAFWDEEQSYVVSGDQKQISWASWAWAVISGMITTDEGTKSYYRLKNNPDAVRPAGPYLMHYVVEAMIICGLRSQALELIREYWGGMVERGADTYWEVYDPVQPKLSPYLNPQINSCCHAWSCTASWFLRNGMLKF